jgi:hypothetical protein
MCKIANPIIQEIGLGYKSLDKILKYHKGEGNLQGLLWGRKTCFSTQNQESEFKMEANWNFQL